MISFDDVSKHYNGVPALRNFSLDINEGETVGLIGPSGGGKTTALKLVNGLVAPDKGSISIDGRPIEDWDMKALRQSIGYVIQEVGLFPHWTVRRNIGVSLTLAGWDEARIRKRVDELLDLVHLDPSIYSGRYPHELSGGQAQRIGVARALALKPKILLMDEPFGALDPLIRSNLQQELLAILASVNTTTLLVTHDLAEAFRLVDRAAVVYNGTVEQVASPQTLYRHPQSEYLKQLIAAEIIPVVT